MEKLKFENLYEDMSALKKEIKATQDGITVTSSILNENKDCKERAESLEKIKKGLERELSFLLFKLALVEDQLKREEERMGEIEFLRI
nr:hypothetical protein [Oscillospiraceae bacterium]